MICVSISDKSKENCLQILDTVELAEIRLDLTKSSSEDIVEIFKHPVSKIATCRFENTGLEVQKQKLFLAIESGAKFVDVEIETPKEQREEIIDHARKYSCKVIISYHNYKETPGLKELFQIADECYKSGADIAKVASMVNSTADNARLMALYSIDKPLVSIGMGELGKVSRLVSVLLGAEFTFAAPDTGKPTAPGQIGFSGMQSLLEQIRKVI
jgi:3-dehydroquinate dehydratase I